MPQRAQLVTRETTTGTNTENLDKGSSLTFAELDKNFIGLRDQTIGIVGDDSTGIDVKAGDTIKFTGSGGATVTAAGDTITITAGGGGGGDLGNLQVNDTTLSPITTNDDMHLIANGSGTVEVEGYTFSDQSIAHVASFDLKTTADPSHITVQTGTTPGDAGHYIELKTREIKLGVNNTNIDITAQGGLGDFTIANATHNSIVLTDDNDGEITITPKTGKWVEIDGLRFPTADGTTGQFLKTNGSGILSFDDPPTNQPTTFVGDDSTGTAVHPNETFKFAGAGGISTSVTGDTLTIDGAGILGDLEIAGQTITGTTTNSNISLVTNGTAEIQLQADTVRAGNTNTDALISSDGSADLRLRCGDSATTNPYIDLQQDEGDIILQTSTSGGTSRKIRLLANNNGILFDTTGLKFTNNVISTQTTDANIDVTNVGTGSFRIDQAVRHQDNIIEAIRSNDDLVINASGTGNVVISGLRFPNSDGSSGQVLQTNGSGVLSFVDQTGGGAAQGITFTGDDSAGIEIADGGQLYIQGGTNITTSANSDGTITITGPDLSSYITATSTDTLQNKTIDTANNTITVTEADISDLGAYITASSTDTLTNKTIDANGTGNSITNLEVADLASGVLDTDLSTVSGSDDTLASAKAIKTYADTKIANVSEDITPQLGGDLDLNSNNITGTGDISITGGIDCTDTIFTTGSIQSAGIVFDDNRIRSSRSNDNLELRGSGTGVVDIEGVQFSADASRIIGPTSGDYLALGTGKLSDEVPYFWNLRSDAVSEHGVSRAFTVSIDPSTMNATSSRIYANNDFFGVTLTGDSDGGSNERFRQIQEINIDLNAFDLNYRDGGRFQSIANIIGSGFTNKGGAASTARQLNGLQAFANIGNNDTTGDITVDEAIAMSSVIDMTPDSGTTATVTDGYGMFAVGVKTGSGGTKAMTNFHAFYAKDDSIATNNNGVTIANDDWTNTLGGMTLQSKRLAIPVSSDPSTVTDSAHIYAKDVASSAEMFVRDEAGNVTQISPHNDQGEWQFYSYNTKTGKKIKINMERMIRKLEEFTGESFIETITD